MIAWGSLCETEANAMIAKNPDASARLEMEEEVGKLFATGATWVTLYYCNESSIGG